MRYVDEFRDSALGRAVLERIRQRVNRPLNLMEVCGTHTVALSRSGIRQLVPQELTLLSGPGCPVCVSAQEEIDKALALARNPEVILATFGDMMKVPGSHSSLEAERAEGADVRVVYSPTDALKIAQRNPDKSVIFYAIGFETTAPSVASSLLEVQRLEIGNFFIVAAHKMIPPAMKALLDMGEVRIDGFICPGHVSCIIGSRPYEPIARDYGIPCVISGFEPLDILQSIDMLLSQILERRAVVENQYRRAVRPQGNEMAQRLMAEVFEKSDAAWRGLGVIPESGLKLKRKYARYDAEEFFEVKSGPARVPPACRCGEVLRGVARPFQCKLFGKTCTPDHPVGPCMVSSEGACAAYYLYPSLATKEG